MAKICSLFSGSSGNCTYIENKDTAILVDAGVSAKKINEAMLERGLDVEKIKAVLPARWHNTVIQLLASCGLVGLMCYSFHRLQTLRLFWKKRKTDILFIGISLLSLLIMSLLDCHFFNIGPTLFYSIALAFAEHLPTENNF